MHVNQGLGTNFSVVEIKGYYNDLTEKVTKDIDVLYSNRLPMNELENGEKVYFPIQIFQYGLGAYDLYLQTGESIYYDKFLLAVQWARSHQLDDGSWDNFSFIYPNAPFSAMCQGEGASLLLRAAKEFGVEKDASDAKKAIDFMLRDITDGGTSSIIEGYRVLNEYTNLPLVLNGWIFAAFGIFDLVLFGYKEYQVIWKQTIDSIKFFLPRFDNGYWSLYDLDGKITSPFYHNLHIAQLEVLYQLTEDDCFLEFENRWKKYRKNIFGKTLAFVKKAVQKVLE